MCSSAATAAGTDGAMGGVTQHDLCPLLHCHSAVLSRMEDLAACSVQQRLKYDVFSRYSVLILSWNCATQYSVLHLRCVTCCLERGRRAAHGKKGHEVAAGCRLLNRVVPESLYEDWFSEDWSVSL